MAHAHRHERLFHTPVACTCGKALDLRSVTSHARTECPDRRIVCRFCGNAMRAGDAASDAVDRIRGYTAHEARCGGKTIKCHLCHASVRQRDLEVHARLHTLDTKSNAAGKAPPMRSDLGQTRSRTSTVAVGGVLTDAQRAAAWARAGFGPAPHELQPTSISLQGIPAAVATPPVERFPPGFLDPVPPTVYHPPNLCATVGCKCAAGTDGLPTALRLCSGCHTLLGCDEPAITPVLLKQLVKVLFLQLMKGCDRVGCTNAHCATARHAPSADTPASAAALALTLAKSAASGGGVPLCLGEHQQKFADTVAQVSSMGFPEAWCVLALDRTGGAFVGDCVRWLAFQCECPRTSWCLCQGGCVNAECGGVCYCLCVFLCDCMFVSR